MSESLFWIALDEKGYSLARELFTQKGTLPGEKVYMSVCKLNLVEQPMPPYPKTHVPPRFWEEALRKLYAIDQKHPQAKKEEDRQVLYESYAPMTVLEQEFYSWYKLLHDNLLPWRDTIGKIQSYWS